jgi:4-carboxymuconolactone decarboxylase
MRVADAATTVAPSPAAAGAATSQRGTIMDKAMHDKGMGVRRAVLGDAYVDNATKSADAFSQPLQDLLNEYCWGAVWGREGLPRKSRSMINLAMIAILNRPHELKAHLRGAMNNGLTKEEISEIFLQVAIYGGMPAAVDAFRTAREFFADFEKEKK